MGKETPEQKADKAISELGIAGYKDSQSMSLKIYYRAGFLRGYEAGLKEVKKTTNDKKS